MYCARLKSGPWGFSSILLGVACEHSSQTSLNLQLREPLDHLDCKSFVLFFTSSVFDVTHWTGYYQMRFFFEKTKPTLRFTVSIQSAVSRENEASPFISVESTWFCEFPTNRTTCSLATGLLSGPNILTCKQMRLQNLKLLDMQKMNFVVMFNISAKFKDFSWRCESTEDKHGNCSSGFLCHCSATSCYRVGLWLLSTATQNQPPALKYKSCFGRRQTMQGWIFLCHNIPSFWHLMILFSLRIRINVKNLANHSQLETVGCWAVSLALQHMTWIQFITIYIVRLTRQQCFFSQLMTSHF